MRKINESQHPNPIRLEKRREREKNKKEVPIKILKVVHIKDLPQEDLKAMLVLTNEDSTMEEHKSLKRAQKKVSWFDQQEERDDDSRR